MARTDEEGNRWWDHHQLNFWLWAFLHDAQEFLQISAALRGGARKPRPTTPEERRAQAIESAREHAFYLENKDRFELAKYHLVATLGSLLRYLRRLESVFPEIQESYRKAEHLRAEGTALRNMIEHADDYIAGKGRQQDKFVREMPLEGLPGDRGAVADATSMIITKDGHWFGARFNLERAIAEVQVIYAVARTIPAPGSTPEERQKDREERLRKRQERMVERAKAEAKDPPD